MATRAGCSTSASRRSRRSVWSTSPTKRCGAVFVAYAPAHGSPRLRAAIATLDSALHLNLIDLEGLAEVFAVLPAKYRALRALVDGRAESRPETLMRLMLRGLGCNVEIQVVFPGIGRVDLLVDGWLVIECDSERYHSGWAKQEADRGRDLALAALGYTTLRPTATAIMWRPEEVRAAVRGLLAARAA